MPKGKNKPYQTKDGKYYIRVGSTNRITTQAELLRLFQATGSFHYDLTPVPGTGLKDLNFPKLDDYFKRYNLDFSMENEDQKTIQEVKCAHIHTSYDLKEFEKDLRALNE